MAELHSSGSQSDVLASFKKNLEGDWKRKATCERSFNAIEERPFYAIDKLTEWMERKNANKVTNAGQLLMSLRHKDRSDPFRISSESILTGDHRCVLVFSILLSLDKGEFIHCFRRAGCVDSKLDTSLDHYELRKYLRLSSLNDPDNLIERFEKVKWSFCPVKLHLNMVGSFKGGERILPFCKRSKFKEKGGIADLWRVSIQEDLLPEELKTRIPGSRVYDKTYRGCYQLVIKSYSTDNFDDYERERAAYNGLQHHDGMIQCLGAYIYEEWHNSNLERSYNLLLEHGDYDLEGFFKDHHSFPPVLTLEVIEFWRSILTVACALRKVHNLDFKNKDGYHCSFDGWHADVKPANILRISGKFKLADFGLATFQRKSKQTPMEYIDGGTAEYGPPERDLGRLFRGTRTPVSQTIDTWSFGCVVSLCATWVVLNLQGVLQYDNLRWLAIQKLREANERGENVSTPTANDAFHDGRDALPEVLHWHSYLRSVLRTSDTVTGPVLDLVDRHMLCSDPSARIDFKQLCTRLEEILDGAEKRHQDLLQTGQLRDIDDTVKEALLEFDNEAPSNTVEAEGAKKNALEQQNAHGVVHSPSTTSQRIGINKRTDSIPIAKTSNRADILGKSLKDHRSRTETANSLQGGQSSGGNEFCLSPIEIDPAEEMASAAKGVPAPLRVSRNFSPKSNNAGSAFVNQDMRSPVTSTVSTEPTYYPVQHETRSNYGMNSFGTGGDSSSNPHVQQQWQQWSPENSPSRRPIAQHDNATHGSTSRQGEPYSPSALTYPPSASPSANPYQELLVTSNVYRVRQELENSRPKGIGRLAAKVGITKKDSTLKKYIDNRDIKFIVDNGWTMYPSWFVATYVLVTLAWKLSGLDDDGLDVVFTIGTESNIKDAKGTNVPERFAAAMKATCPDQGSKTDMKHTLGQAFDEYIRTPPKKRKRMTLIVLTDGIWEDSVKENGVEMKIADFLSTLRTVDPGFEDRRFSIQFIRFGDDPGARARLEALDNTFWRDYGVDDVVDTVPWTGSVRKMILGSFKEGEDEVDDDGGSTATHGPLSPESLGSPTQVGRRWTLNQGRDPMTHGSFGNGQPSALPAELPGAIERSWTGQTGSTTTTKRGKGFFLR